MRKVLFVAYPFPPMVAGGAPRTGQLARILPEFGWMPTVLTTAVPEASAHDGASLAALDSRVRVIRVPDPLARAVGRGRPRPRTGIAGLRTRLLRKASSLVFFPDREAPWSAAAIRAGLRACREARFDLVLATSPPMSSLVAGASIARLAGLPLVVDFRDLWAEYPFMEWPSPLHRAAALATEGRIVRGSSAVVGITTEMTRKITTRHGVPEMRQAAIPNGFDPDRIEDARDGRTPSEGPFRLVFTGSVTPHHDFRPFFAALRLLRDRGAIDPERLEVRFVGNMPDGDIEAAGVSDLVHLSGFVPHREVFRALGLADALLLLETPGYWSHYSFAAKGFDYLITGKPVLMLGEEGGHTAEMLRAAGVGRIADPRDPAAIASVIESMLPLRGAPPRAVDPGMEPWKRYNRRTLVAELARLLDEVADGGAGSGPGC